jgi:hypothetical protein
MAAGSTYSTIATTTLGSNVASYTFSSIPSTYTDLVLISFSKTTITGDNLFLEFNSDTGNNYSSTYLYGNGSSASSGRGSNQSTLLVGTADSAQFITIIANIMNYSNTTTFKSVLSRTNDTAGLYPAVGARAGLWRSTSAINSIKIYVPNGGNLATNSTFTLYGIAAA